MAYIRVTAAVMEKDGRILVARRKIGSHQENMWEFPGGKIEDGESPEICLERELGEEFGIKAEIGEFLMESIHDYGDKHICLLAYEVKHVSGEFRLNDHEEIRWVLPEEMQSLDFAEADIPIVNFLSSFCKKSVDKK
jgi:mutator protein MutT